MDRSRTFRKAGWLVVAGMLVTALLAPASTSAATSGAIWTTYPDGTVVNANVSYTSQGPGVPQRRPAELR